MGAGTQTTTQNTTAKPYGPAKPLINTALQDAMKAYSKGVGGQVFTGSTVVPFSRQTKAGMDSTMQNARWNMNNPSGLVAQSKNIIAGGGLTGDQSQAMQGLRGLAGNQNLNSYINGDGLNNYQRSTMQNWQDTANSQFDLNANPAFQKVQQNAIDQATGAVSRQAAAAGRYGSGANQQILSREIGNTAAGLANNEYRNWQNRVDQANQNIFGGGSTANAQQMNAMNMKSGLENNIFNMGQTGQQNMAAAYQNMNAPAKDMMGVGSMYEDLAKRQMDDRLRIFNEKQNMPWDQIGRLMGVGNLTSTYAPRNTVSTAPGPNPLLQTLQGVTGGLGLLGGLFGTGGASGGGTF